MSTVDRDIEDLRQEYRRQASLLTRTGLTGASILFVLVLAFAGATSRVNSEEASESLAEMRALAKISGENPDVSYVFKFALDENPTSSGNATPEQKEQATRRQAELARQLESQAKGWYTLKPSILGIGVELDIRSWIVLLPVLFWGFASYLAIARTKLKLLREVAVRRVRENPEASATVDQIYFGSVAFQPTAFARHPGQIEALAYGFLVLGLIVQLGMAGKQFFELWDEEARITAAFCLAIMTIYVVAYTRRTTSRLEAQMAPLIGVSLPPNRLDRLWQAAASLSGWFGRLFRFFPRISLATGASLTLLTLVLATAQTCGGERRTGYELLMGQNEAQWFLGGFLSGLSNELLGRSAYMASLGLAVLTLLFLSVALFRPRLLEGMWVRWPCRLSGAISLFLVSDFFFIYWLNIIFVADTLRVIYWLVPVLLWSVYAFSKRPQRRERWPTFRSTWAVLYAPGVVPGLLALIAVTRKQLFGLPVLFAGVLLMSLGYLELVAKRRSPDSDTSP